MVELNELLKPPNKEQSAIIRKALKEDEDRLLNNVKLLEEWVSCQKHLPQDYDRRLLFAYIRGCKHNMEKAKRKIELFFSIRSTQHELYADRIISIDGDLSATTFAMMITLPEFTPEGHRVTIFKITNPNLDIFDQRKLFRYGLISGDFRAHADNLVAGEILVFDAGLITAALASKNLTSLLRKVILIVQDVYPSLIKQIHVVTDRTFIEKAINIIKVFLKEKIRNRIYVHKTYDSLRRFIPIKCLPADYGGSQKSLEELHENWRTLYIQERNFFERLSKVKVKGNVPQNLIKDFNDDEDNFGIQGSFRQLNID